MRRRPSADDEGILILREWLGLDREPLRLSPEQWATIGEAMEGLATTMAKTDAVLRDELERRAREAEWRA